MANERFYSFLKNLVKVTHEEPFDRDKYIDVITDICNSYRIAKGVTTFYTSPMMEKRGIGESFCDVDNGKGDKVLIHHRFVSENRAVICGDLYEEASEPERSAEEIEELDVLFRILIGFVSRKRLIKILGEFGFSDMDGFLNFRSFVRYLDIASVENRLDGMIAFHFDIHNFTMVNQEIGRQNGDTVLKNYYKLLKDAIGENGIIARLGGDKFIGLFERSKKRQIFDIFSGVSVPYDETGEKKISIRVAAGVFLLPNPFVMRNIGDIMDKIIMAGNAAKRNKESTIVVYDDRMKAEKDRVKRVQTDFRSALENEEYVVYYQPKVNLETRELQGAEALCRWIKDGKVIPPADFIPILEMNMDICDLDFYMLDHVCKDIRRWLDEKKRVVRVSVNFSRKHLVDVDLLDHIMEIIDRNKVPHEYIEIELTETTTDVMFRDLKRVVCGLQELGVWTAVDDFGVGFSSLNLIRDIPWNVLKVDKTFVPKSIDDNDNMMNLMFRHVISLAQDIGLECVIEGVESVDQLEVLKENNCNIVQGYFFDRPLPLEEFEQRIDRIYYPE